MLKKGVSKMAQNAITELNDNMFNLLQNECFVLLATIDHETHGPNVNAISWVNAIDTTTVRFAVGHKSRIVDNIKTDPQVNLTLFTAGSVYTISGKAQVVEDAMEGISIKLAMIEVKIDTVRDVMFYGAEIAQEPTYVKSMNQELAQKLDIEVLQALKA